MSRYPDAYKQAFPSPLHDRRIPAGSDCSIRTRQFPVWEGSPDHFQTRVGGTWASPSQQYSGLKPWTVGILCDIFVPSVEAPKDFFHSQNGIWLLFCVRLAWDSRLFKPSTMLFLWTAPLVQLKRLLFLLYLHLCPVGLVYSSRAVSHVPLPSSDLLLPLLMSFRHLTDKTSRPTATLFFSSVGLEDPHFPEPL